MLERGTIHRHDGPIRLGCVPDLPVQLLQAFLGTLYSDHPMLEVEVQRLRSSEQVARLERGDLELVILHGHTDSAQVESRPMFPGGALAVFVPDNHSLASRPVATREDLRLERAVALPMASDPIMLAQLARLLDRNGYRFRELREIAGADLRDLLFAVAEARGVAIAPRAALHTAGDVAGLVCARNLAPALRLPDTMLAWRSEPNPGLAKIVAAASEAAEMLYAWGTKSRSACDGDLVGRQRTAYRQAADAFEHAADLAEEHARREDERGDAERAAVERRKVKQAREAAAQARTHAEGLSGD